MVDVETLRIIIDIVDEFSDEIAELKAQLLELNTIAEGLDNIVIDVDVRGERELDSLMAKMAALQLEEQATGVGIDAATSRVQGRGGGGGGVGGGIGGLGAMLADFFDGITDMFGDVDTNAIAKSAGQASENMGDVADTADGLFSQILDINLSMSDMHNALAALIPVILVVIGALPALITGFAAVAAAALSAAVALAALGGLGLVGAAMARAGGERPAMEDFGEILSEMVNDIFDAIAPVAAALGPIFERGMDGLGSFVAGIMEGAIELQRLGDEAEGFASFLEEWLAGAIANMVNMTEAFAPLFSMLGDFLNDFSLLEALTVMMADMLDPFLAFIGLMMHVIPMLVQLSIGFLKVTNAIIFVTDVLLNLFSILTLGNEQAFGVVLASLLALATAAVILGFAIRKNIIAGMLGAIKTAGIAALEFLSLAAAKIATASAAGVLTLAIKAVTTAIIGMLAATGIGLIIPILGGIASGFLGIASGADEAVKSLRDFDRMQNKFSDGTNPFAPSPTKRGELFSRSARGVTINTTIEGNADETDIATGNNRTLWVERKTGGASGI